MSYIDEFPDFTMDVEIPHNWDDTSWHNDACPSFEVGRVRIWVDHADRELSEFPSSPRFQICTKLGVDEYGEVRGTNSWGECLDIVRAMNAEAQRDARDAAQDGLCAAYSAWQAMHGLMLGSADEHLTDARLTETQRKWLASYITIWESIVR